jgi:hypothetical protein
MSRCGTDTVCIIVSQVPYRFEQSEGHLAVVSGEMYCSFITELQDCAYSNRKYLSLWCPVIFIEKCQYRNRPAVLRFIYLFFPHSLRQFENQRAKYFAKIHVNGKLCRIFY